MILGRSWLLNIATQPLSAAHHIAEPRNVPVARAIFVSKLPVPKGVIVGAAVMKRMPVTGFEAASTTPDVYVVRQTRRVGAALRPVGMFPPRRIARIPIQISSVAVLREARWAILEPGLMIRELAAPAVAMRIHPT
jgi:hypothetical protein